MEQTQPISYMSIEKAQQNQELRLQESPKSTTLQNSQQYQEYNKLKKLWIFKQKKNFWFSIILIGFLVVILTVLFYLLVGRMHTILVREELQQKDQQTFQIVPQNNAKIEDNTLKNIQLNDDTKVFKINRETKIAKLKDKNQSVKTSNQKEIQLKTQKIKQIQLKTSDTTKSLIKTKEIKQEQISIDSKKYQTKKTRQESPAIDSKKDQTKTKQIKINSFEGFQQITKNTQNNIKNPSSQINSSTSSFSIPKKIWVYRSSNQQVLSLTAIVKQNQKMFAQKSGYSLIEINDKNFVNYLDKKTSNKIQFFRKELGSKLAQINSKYLLSQNKHILAVRICKTIITAHILLQNGGIAVDRDLLLTESLQWLYNIHQNPYVNRDLRDNGTQVFAFYDLKLSSPDFVKNYDTTFQIVKPYRMLKQLPGMTTEFIAAKPNAVFMMELCSYLMDIFRNPQVEFQEMLKDQRLTQIFKSQLSYTHFSHSLTVSALRILIQKFKEFNSQTKNNQKGNAYDRAFNYYRLSLMNSGYGPKRLEYQVLRPDRYQQKFLTQVFQQQLETMFGKVRYCTFLPSAIRGNNNYLNQIYKDKTRKVTQGSFFQRMFFNQDDQRVVKNKEIPKTDLNGPQWTALPRKLWVIWDKGYNNTSIAKQLMIKNLFKKAKQSGVSPTLITAENVHLYLDKETLDKIEYAIKNTKFRVFRPLRSNLLRIALVYKYGGIYMDVSMIMVQKLDWIFNISRIPSNFLWNRYGILPKIFMGISPWLFNPADWVINQTHNTKSATVLGYQNSFFAAQPKSQLLHDWFQLYINNLVNPYNQTDKLLNQAGLTRYRMTKQGDFYLIAMQSLRLAIVRKQIQLQSKGIQQWSNANHYYGAWYLNMLVGISKYRCFYMNHLQLDNPSCKWNQWLSEYSQQYTQGLIGKVHYFVKLHSPDAEQLRLNLVKHVDSWSELHTGSVLYKHLLSHGQRLINVNSKLQWNFSQKDL